MLSFNRKDSGQKDMEMNIGDLFLGMAFVSVVWGAISSMVITAFVAARGTKINYFLYRLYIIKYVNQYKQITEAESSRPGPWFYSFVVCMLLALILFVIGVILKSL